MWRKNRMHKKQNVAGEFTKKAGKTAEAETEVSAGIGAETEEVAIPAEAGEHNMNLSNL
jgi:hypothetical protein